MLEFPILSRNAPAAEYEFEPKPELGTCNLPLLVVLPLPQWVVFSPYAPNINSIEPLVTWIFIRGIRGGRRVLILLHVGRDPTIYRGPASGRAFDA